jgi:hypothetical protein
MFDKKSATVSIEGFDVNDTSSWIKINPKLTGFYRVKILESIPFYVADRLFRPLY